MFFTIRGSIRYYRLIVLGAPWQDDRPGRYVYDKWVRVPIPWCLRWRHLFRFKCLPVISDYPTEYIIKVWPLEFMVMWSSKVLSRWRRDPRLQPVAN